MKSRFCILIISALLLLSRLGVAQNDIIPMWKNFLSRGPVRSIPFAAEIIGELSYPPYETHGHLYRDSEGRVRAEVQDEKGLVHIYIFDPVQQTVAFLDPDTETATIYPMTKPPFLSNPKKDGGRAVELEDAIAERTEGLGTRDFEGFRAFGIRHVKTVKVGPKDDDKIVKVIREDWYSLSLMEELMLIRDDPRFGRSTERLTKIQRNHPDPLLFQIPSDYTTTAAGGNPSPSPLVWDFRFTGKPRRTRYPRV
jgi:hypothetical protein